jgi:predicted dehydrogenase
MINVAVIGCGYWGPNLLRNLWSLPGCTVLGVCDKDQDRLDHMASLYAGLRTVQDHEELLSEKNLDAVVVATPVNSHNPLAIECLSAGKHVFVEKPLADSVEAGTEMVNAAAAASRVLMVGHTYVYSPPVNQIKEIVDSGEIGDVLYINSRRLNLGLFQKDINVMWDLAPHDLSIILYLLGHDPVTVSCQGADHFNRGIEDITNLTLMFPNEVLVSVQSSWLDPRKIREMTIVGSKKMIVYDDTEPLEKVKIYDKRVEVPPHYDTYAEFQFSYHYGDISIPYVKQAEPLKIETQHFLSCIEEGCECQSGGEEGLRVVSILERANESLHSNGARIGLK